MYIVLYSPPKIVNLEKWKSTIKIFIIESASDSIALHTTQNSSFSILFVFMYSGYRVSADAASHTDTESEIIPQT